MFVTIGLHPLFLHYLFPSFPLVPSCSYCVSFVLPFTVASFSAVISLVTQRFSPTSREEKRSVTALITAAKETSITVSLLVTAGPLLRRPCEYFLIWALIFNYS